MGVALALHVSVQQLVAVHHTVRAANRVAALLQLRMLLLAQPER
jgi:hypothetical protein